MIELKPCPRCGSSAEMARQHWSGRDYYSVVCGDSAECGLWLDSRSSTQDEAAIAWNTRKAAA